MDNQQIIDAWSNISPQVLTEFGDEGDFDRQHLLNPHLLRLIGSADGQVILDAGCGNGYLARKLARLGAKVTGVEPAEALYQAALTSEYDQPLGITYLQQDLSHFDQTPFFDTVVSNMVFMDIPDWQAAVSNCIRALKPGGTFILSNSHPAFENSSDEYRHVGHIEITDYLNHYSIDQTYGQRFHRPLSEYINFSVQQNCRLTEVVEPQLSSKVVEQHPTHARSHFIPNFIIMSMRKDA